MACPQSPMDVYATSPESPVVVLHRHTVPESGHIVGEP